MLVADDPSRILLLGCASAQRVAPLVSSTGEERRHYVTEFIRLLQRRHMSNSFDSVKDGVWDVLRQKAGSVPADVIVLTQHDERGDLDAQRRPASACRPAAVIRTRVPDETPRVVLKIIREIYSNTRHLSIWRYERPVTP